MGVLVTSIVGGGCKHTFSEEVRVNTPINSYPIIKRQARIQRKAMKILPGIQIDLLSLLPACITILIQIPNRHTALQIHNRHITLHGGPIQRCGCRLSSLLTALIPRACPNGEALTRAHDAVERVQRGTADQRGLVGDPEVADAVEGVGEDDTPVAQADLEDGAVLGDPGGGDAGVVAAQLEEVAEEGDAGDFGEVLDLWGVRAVEEADGEDEEGEEDEGEGCGGQGFEHGGRISVGRWCFLRSPKCNLFSSS
jgi:hypothetical protein